MKNNQIAFIRFLLSFEQYRYESNTGIDISHYTFIVHFFAVNIRICQPENSDVHRGEVEVNINFEG